MTIFIIVVTGTILLLSLIGTTTEKYFNQKRLDKKEDLRQNRIKSLYDHNG